MAIKIYGDRLLKIFPVILSIFSLNLCHKKCELLTTAKISKSTMALYQFDY